MTDIEYISECVIKPLEERVKVLESLLHVNPKEDEPLVSEYKLSQIPFPFCG